MRLSDFDYTLPRELIAQYPLKTRDASKMMVLDRDKKSITHKHFRDITSYLKSGDAAVFNNTRVIPARIHCKRETGGKAEIFLLKRIKDNIHEALARPASKLPGGRKLFYKDGTAIAEILESRGARKLIKFTNSEADLKRIGRIPLPPYIKREPEKEDEQRYQTIYAAQEGSTASPTAGLHFTESILQQFKEKDVSLSYVTLHVSYGTFAPVKAEDVEDHKMHEEYFHLEAKTIKNIIEAKGRKKRVLAVGTTSTRVLESNSDLLNAKRYPLTAKKGWTDYFIYPPYKFKAVDMLLTNFHLPKSTLLILVSAFAGREFIMQAYQEAIRRRYRFFSYGDCMLIM